PKLLSKLAALELCGWIEGEQDRLIRTAAATRIDPAWLESYVIAKTYGFNYQDHFRGMLTKLFGEVITRKIESAFEASHPGDLDQLKSDLGALWKLRCNFAHADIGANVAAQQTFNAPSWSINKLRIIKRTLTNYEACMIRVLTGI
ncbi:MAG TPA: hypothetical protein VF050_12310, partial [Moraxellaceae bacterium]